MKVLAPASLVFLVLFILYHLIYASRVIPGVSVSNIRVGGRASPEVRRILSDRMGSTNIVLVFTYEDKKFEIRGKDIQLSYDTDKTVQKVFDLGRSGKVIVDGKDKVAALVKGIRVPPIYSYDKELLNQKISLIEGTVNIQSQDPTFVLVGDNDLVATREKEGRSLNKNKLRNSILLAIENFSSGEIELDVKTVVPENTQDDILKVKGEVLALINNPPIVSYGEKVWTFSKQDTLTLLAYKKVDSEVEIVSNKAAVSKLADDLAAEVDVEPRGEVFKTDGDRVVEFRPKTDGQLMDRSKFKKDFALALTDVNYNKNVGLSVSSSKAPGDTNKYGIYSLIGEGVSYFTGSIPGRIKNLTLAASRASGVLVAPGEIYSFNKSVGEISAATGYQQAYIIENGRTVLGDGGGVCQTSTTLYRAVLNAGLPVVKRTAHAYRVKYYEIKSDIGFDATVYSPYVDFQFKNDTPNYILVQADWDLKEYMLRFRIYGTPDGRTVEITKPVVTNVIAPAEPLYQDDPTLKKGVVNQVEWAYWGATATFKRTVKRGGAVLYEDTFVSKYQPWRAMYMVGTKK